MRRSSKKPPSGGSTAVVRAAGLDLSLTGTGFIVRRSKPVHDRLLATKPLDSKSTPKFIKEQGGGIHPKSGVFYGTLEDRIDWQVARIMSRLKRFPVELIAIEGYSFASHDKGMRDRCELTGVVKHRLRRADIAWTLIPPKSLKLYATGNGNASKEEMIAAANAAGFECSNDNVADAYWLADHAWNMGLGNLPATG
jgi:Holliday junction resolvasome RuvABC endonuclease subunit